MVEMNKKPDEEYVMSDEERKDFDNALGHNAVAILTLLNLPEDRPHNDLITAEDSGCVYTLGHRLHDRPEILGFAGPMEGEKAYTIGKLSESVLDLGRRVDKAVARWPDKPFIVGKTIKTKLGRRYLVSQPSPEEAIKHKKGLIYTVGQYYGTDDYDLLLLTPIHD